MTQPIFRDGRAENLEAAALDALEWLRLMRQLLSNAEVYPGERWNDTRWRLVGAIRSLDRLLPDKEPVFHESSTYWDAALVRFVISSRGFFDRDDLLSEFMITAGIR